MPERINSSEEAWEITKGRIAKAMEDYGYFLETGHFPEVSVETEAEKVSFLISTSAGEVIFEPEFQRLRTPEHQFNLTPTLTKVFVRLLQTSGEVQTFEQLYRSNHRIGEKISDIESVQGLYYRECIRPVIHYLRKVLRQVHPGLGDRVVNVRGEGYFWNEEEIKRDKHES